MIDEIENITCKIQCSIYTLTRKLKDKVIGGKQLCSIEESRKNVEELKWDC